MLLSRAFGTVAAMNGELQNIQTRDHLEFFIATGLVNSTSVLTGNGNMFNSRCRVTKKMSSGTVQAKTQVATIVDPPQFSLDTTFKFISFVNKRDKTSTYLVL